MTAPIEAHTISNRSVVLATLIGMTVFFVVACTDEEDNTLPLMPLDDGATGSDNPDGAIPGAPDTAQTTTVDADSPDLAVDAALIGPAPGDTFASPTGVDTANTCVLESAPCLTIAKATAQALPGATVWLLGGTFPVESVTVPAGLSIRGRTQGNTIVRGRLKLAGGRVQDVVFEETSNGTSGITITAGTVSLEGIGWRGMYYPRGLDISGSAIVTLRPGTVENYVGGGIGSRGEGLLVVRDTAQLTMIGGTWDAPGLGAGQLGLARNGYGSSFHILGKAKLRAEGVTFRVNTRGIAVMGEASLELVGCTITPIALEGFGYGVMLFDSPGTARLVATDTTISGFTWLSSGGIYFSDDGAANTATVTLNNVTLQNNANGIWLSSQSVGTVVATGLVIRNNLFSGVYCSGRCALDINGGTITENAGYPAPGYGIYGGIWMGNNNPHRLKLRNVVVTNNKTVLVDGNTNTPGNSGVTMMGSAVSVFDLGTLASPGGNTFSGNDTGPLTSGLNVNVAAGVTVNAVGNTFTAALQGANAQGQYVLGAAPCMANSCTVTSGGGLNYRVTSGTLRLAE